MIEWMIGWIDDSVIEWINGGNEKSINERVHKLKNELMTQWINLCKKFIPNSHIFIQNYFMSILE